MRRARLKGEPEAEASYYHCISRIVDRRFVLDVIQKEVFVRIMRGYEIYCGVQVVTFCVMSNHFHVLLRVPRRPSSDLLPSDVELVERLRAAVSGRLKCTTCGRINRVQSVPPLRDENGSI